MTIIRLLVLGALRNEPAHGYAVQRLLASWRVETWTRIRPGSIYHALNQLTKEGKLDALGTEESPEGPSRTRYAITKDGLSELETLLESALRSFDLEQLSAGIALMHLLPRSHAIALLREQNHKATENHEHLGALIASFPDRNEPPHTQDLLALWRDALRAMAGNTMRLVRHLEDGEYAMAGDHPQSRQTKSNRT